MMDYHQNQRAKRLDKDEDLKCSPEMSHHREILDDGHVIDQESHRDDNPAKKTKGFQKKSKTNIINEAGRRSQNEREPPKKKKNYEDNRQ
jgi:hypothetical protein